MAQSVSPGVPHVSEAAEQGPEMVDLSRVHHIVVLVKRVPGSDESSNVMYISFFKNI